MFLKQLLFVFLLFTSSEIFSQSDLDNYVKRLRQSQATGGSETAFLSAGSSFLYGQDYFEAGRYDMAAMYFKQALDKEGSNPYFNYQLGISLLKQNDELKKEEAQKYLQKALELNPNLKTGNDATTIKTKAPPNRIQLPVKASRLAWTNILRK